MVFRELNYHSMLRLKFFPLEITVSVPSQLRLISTNDSRSLSLPYVMSF